MLHDPRVYLNILERDTLLRVKYQESLDEIPCFCADKAWDCVLSPRNLALCHDLCVLKRRFADQELICQDTQTPQVNLLGVVVVLAATAKHLRGQVVESSAHGVSAVVGCVNRPTKVRNLDLAVNAYEDVLGLDVAVHDVLLVEVLERCGHLGNILCCFPFWEALFLAEVLVEFSLAGELENEENALCVVEVTEQLEDVGVGEM